MQVTIIAGTHAGAVNVCRAQERNHDMLKNMESIDSYSLAAKDSTQRKYQCAYKIQSTGLRLEAPERRPQRVGPRL